MLPLLLHNSLKALEAVQVEIAAVVVVMVVVVALLLVEDIYWPLLEAVVVQVFAGSFPLAASVVEPELHLHSFHVHSLSVVVVVVAAVVEFVVSASAVHSRSSSSCSARPDSAPGRIFAPDSEPD